MNSDQRADSRAAGVAGVAAAVLLLVSALIRGGEPFPDASIDTLLGWYHQHRHLIQITSALNGLAAIPLLVFVSGIRHRLARDEGRSGWLSTTLFAGAITSTTVATIGSLPALMLVLAANRTGPAPSDSVVHLLADLNFFQHGNLGLLSAVFVGALGWLALRGNLASRWVGWLAMTAGAFAVIGGTVSFFPSTAGKPNPIGLLGFIGFVLTQIAVLATGLHMIKTRASSDTEAAAAHLVSTP